MANVKNFTDQTTHEIDIDIEVIKAQILIIKTKKAERLMFTAGVKWHEEGEKNNAYFLGLFQSISSLLINSIHPFDKA